jgi:DNA/RNA-binding protein KIN17
MGKPDAGGLRAMANASKSRGLQQLKYYCQMCSKQCRDADGFKCHTMSEGHLRKMQEFSSNSNQMINDFSKDFEKGYLRILYHRHGTKRVEANKIYQEYIADKHHTHMNATIWATLSDFCKHLGKESLAVVEETEQGWYVTYIDRDPRLLARQASELAARKDGHTDDDRARLKIKAQMDAAAAAATEASVSMENNQEKYADDQEGEVKLKLNTNATTKKNSTNKRSLANLMKDSDDGILSKKAKSEVETATTTGRSALERIMMEDKQRQERQSLQQQQQLTLEKVASGRDDWLHTGIYVRVMNKKIGDGRFYKQRGVVVAVHDTYVATIEVDGASIRVDQDELETVIPKVNKSVMFVNGTHRGARGMLVNIDQDSFSCTVEMKMNDRSMHTVQNVEFEHISRLVE